MDDPNAPTLSPDLVRREQYLEREIGGLASDRITATKLPTTLGEDVTGHLNEQGTVEVLDIMDRKFTSELMLNPAYLVSERLTRGCKPRTDMVVGLATSWGSSATNWEYT